MEGKRGGIVPRGFTLRSSSVTRLRQKGAQDDNYVAFSDIKPASKYHYLIIPKQHISDAKSLVPEQKTLVEDLVRIAKQILEQTGVDLSDVRFGFHWPPFHSISHLHLHAIAPASQMGFISRGIFKPDSWWFVTHFTTGRVRKGGGAERAGDEATLVVVDVSMLDHGGVLKVFMLLVHKLNHATLGRPGQADVVKDLKMLNHLAKSYPASVGAHRNWQSKPMTSLTIRHLVRSSSRFCPTLTLKTVNPSAIYWWHRSFTFSGEYPNQPVAQIDTQFFVVHDIRTVCLQRSREPEIPHMEVSDFQTIARRHLLGKCTKKNIPMK
uniref:Adenosine 5'-monophosphoramidase HINT3 n=1 Tax=Timema genevievae TaxID=629358 RepID=A0A7R9PKH6_TIMGE|nr:unnamed protein product [Timema genevievae]